MQLLYIRKFLRKIYASKKRNRADSDCTCKSALRNTYYTDAKWLMVSVILVSLVGNEHDNNCLSIYLKKSIIIFIKLYYTLLHLLQVWCFIVYKMCFIYIYICIHKNVFFNIIAVWNIRCWSVSYAS